MQKNIDKVENKKVIKYLQVDGKRIYAKNIFSYSVLLFKPAKTGGSLRGATGQGRTLKLTGIT